MSAKPSERSTGSGRSPGFESLRAQRTTDLTHGSFAEDKIERLCSALGLPHTRSLANDVFRCLADPWARWPLGASPAWETDICDDGTPFEFSVAFDGLAPSLRMLVESQQWPGANLGATWSAALGLNERLREWPGVDLSRFEKVRDLFAPSADSSARFSLWHAADIAPDGKVSFKAYLNPRIRSAESSVPVALEALRRLDMNDAAAFLEARLYDLGTPYYFSLDLSSSQAARAKVYMGAPTTYVDQLEGALEGCRHYVPGDATHWITRLTHTRIPSAERPILSCFAFSEDSEAPLVTVHVPIRCFVRDDAKAIERAAEFLNPRQARTLRSAVDSLAARSLHRSAGLVSYVSLRRTATNLRLTAYLSPEAYRVQGPAEHSCVSRVEVVR